VGRNGQITIPSSVRRISLLDFYEGGDIIVEDGCEFIDEIDMSHGGHLFLPRTVIAVAKFRIHFGSVYGCSPRFIYELEIVGQPDVMADGTRFLGCLISSYGNPLLPSTVVEIGKVAMESLDDNVPATVPASVFAVGSIDLQNKVAMNLPDTLAEVGYIRLRDQCDITLPQRLFSMAQIDCGADCTVTISPPQGGRV
jgi:hypothetical protein